MTEDGIQGSEGKLSQIHWADIIGAVKTPLGFFSLAILAVEAILAVGVAVTEGTDRHLLVVGMLGLILFLVVLVSAMAIWRPRALYGEAPATEPEIIIQSEEMQGPIEIISRPIVAAMRVPLDYECEYNEISLRQFQSDVRVITASFARCYFNDALGCRGLRELLSGKKFDVLHLSASVQTNDGDISSNPFYESPSEKNRISAEGFIELIRHAEVKLVVLASCNSITLASKISPYVSMIAGSKVAREDSWEAWSRLFYQLLASGIPLSRAFKVARASTDMPVTMFLHKDFIAKPGPRRSRDRL